MTVILITLLYKKTKVVRPLIRYFAQFGFKAILNEGVGVNWGRARGPSTCWFKFTKSCSARLKRMTPLAVSWNLCHLNFFTIYLSSNLGSGLGTRLSFKVLILTEKKFIYRSFHFLSRQGSAQPNQAQKQWKSAMVVISEKSSDWNVLREDGYNS